MNTPTPLTLDEDRLFASDPIQRAIARRLYALVAKLPIVSPHGHTDPAWFAGTQPSPITACIAQTLDSCGPPVLA